MPSNAHYPSDPRGSRGITFRRRRVILLSSIVIGLLFFFFVPWEIPGSLRGVNVSRANFLSLANRKKAPVGEIYGLFHIVTGDEEQAHVLNNPQLDPTASLDMSTYAPTFSLSDWRKEKQRIDEEFPLIVFSKTWCPYSQRAKTILSEYDLQPPPKIVEVDLRDDGGILKALLTRLSQRSTVPNIFLLGNSIGGMTELYELSTNGSLKTMFEEAGLDARKDGSTFRFNQARKPIRVIELDSKEGENTP